MSRWAYLVLHVHATRKDEEDAAEWEGAQPHRSLTNNTSNISVRGRPLYGGGMNGGPRWSST